MADYVQVRESQIRLWRENKRELLDTIEDLKQANTRLKLDNMNLRDAMEMAITKFDEGYFEWSLSIMRDALENKL